MAIPYSAVPPIIAAGHCRHSFTYKAVGASYTMDQLMVIEAKAKSFFGRHNVATQQFRPLWNANRQRIGFQIDVGLSPAITEDLHIRDIGKTLEKAVNNKLGDVFTLFKDRPRCQPKIKRGPSRKCAPMLHLLRRF